MAMAIHTPPARRTMSSAKSTAPMAMALMARPRRWRSQRLREILAQAPVLLRRLVGRGAAAQQDDELVEHGDEEDHGARHERRLRDPDRNEDEPLRHLLELPALVDEPHHGIDHVADAHDRKAEGGERHGPARPRPKEVDHQADADQLAAAERVTEGKEGGSGAEPRDDVIGAAQQQAELAHERLREHDRRDGGEAHRGERPARRVEAVEEPPQAAYPVPGRDSASTTSPTGSAR